MTEPNLRNESNYGIYFAETFNGSLVDQNDSITPCANFTMDSKVVGVGVFLAVFISVAIVGNILVILSVVCNKHLQTVTNFFIVNLAIADLLLSIIVLPFSASLEVLGCWVFGRVFCNIWAAVDVLCCTASILSLCVISIDRYIGVKHCLKYPTIMTERKAVAILVLVWVSSTVISVGPLLGWKEPPPVDERICKITEEPGYALFSSLFSFYLPLMVILIMYFRVYVVARRTTKSLEAGVKRERNKSIEVVLRIHCRSVLEDARPSSSKNHPFRSSLSVRLMKFSREKKAAKTLAIVVGMFILCWMPFFFFLSMGTRLSSARLTGCIGVPSRRLQHDITLLSHSIVRLSEQPSIPSEASEEIEESAAGCSNQPPAAAPPAAAPPAAAPAAMATAHTSTHPLNVYAPHDESRSETQRVEAPSQPFRSRPTLGCLMGSGGEGSGVARHMTTTAHHEHKNE
ncbi:alpha-1D adrenergic receptor-like [Notothenia coriiceps]|uniref:Alpha-1D adrenergic receptor-like n=1 Tax=Notothenia coriiceps TaxID=8208 RepID=A0A6I9PVN6_9TELE|nr:PREDICTED: alpha-1D adrenergic receptor-like [Notothenia coriiceps]